MKQAFGAVLSLLCLAVQPTQADAASCYVNGGVGLTSPIASHTHLGGVICGKLIEGSGCVVNLTNDATGSTGADCLRIGRGVTVNGAWHTFTCPAGVQCGNAITASYSGTSGTSQIDEVIVQGRWAIGVSGNNSSVPSTLTNARIDLADGANRGGIGVSAIKNSSSVVVQNADVGIKLIYTGGASDCIVHDCGLGVESTYDNTTLNNCLIIDNDTAMEQSVFGAARTNTSSSVIRGSTCDCENWQNVGSCDIDNCANFTNGASFVDDEIR